MFKSVKIGSLSSWTSLCCPLLLNIEIVMLFLQPSDLQTIAYDQSLENHNILSAKSRVKVSSFLEFNKKSYLYGSAPVIKIY